MKENNVSKHYNYKDYLLRKLVMYFLIFSLILSVMIMISFKLSQTRLTVNLGSQIAYAFSEKMNTWVHGLVLEMKGIAITSESVQNVDNEMNDNFIEICGEKPGYFETFFVSNISGEANDCHHLVYNLDDRSYFHEIIINGQDVAISGPVISKASGQPVIVIAVKLSDKNGKTNGLFGGAVNLKQISEMMSDIKIESLGEAVIVDREGHLICSSNTDERYTLNMNFFEPFNEGIKQRITEMDTGFLNTVNPYNTQKNEFIFVNNMENTPGWKLLVFFPESKINDKIMGLTLMISVILIAGTIILTLIIRYSANRIVRPLEKTILAIDKFNTEEYKLNIPETEIIELNKLKTAFENMAFDLFKTMEEKEKYSEEILAANEELNANNEELERSYQQLEKLSVELEKIFETAAQLNHVALKSEEEYLHHLLEMLIKTIDKADYGTVSLYEDDTWNFICAIGHDIEKLREIKLKKYHQISLPKTIVVKNVLKEGTKVFEESARQKIIDASQPVEHSILGELRIGNEVVGTISIDSAKDSEEFTDEDIRLFDAFRNFAGAFLGTKRHLNAKNLYQEKLVLSIIKILEFHDPYTKGHSENVGIMAEKLASQYGLSADKCQEIYWAGLVHDIGKILIPSNVLMKTGRLTMEEYEQIKQHPVWGAEILSTADELDSMVQAVKYHHERWDGTGYPFGIKGYDIPLYSRIISVADTFDAMTSDRSYRVALSFEDAVEEIRKNSGSQFDPEIVKAFIDMLENRKILV
ncbi:MAG TPA: HD domain-containing protein [Thermotogota bacterium]|nr:HD domain-containing protein [Thermotogota bacterium]HPJ87899.1 HD domain-containing protein [Thermotogota bacterium]HPR94992.1 HD domain-containing protein [Thermotogota bacterium]